jgi:hypothetical protein
MLNRDVLVVRFKQPFVDWLNAADPHPGKNPIALAEANKEISAFLIDASASLKLRDCLKENYLRLFEVVLKEWFRDPSLWPQDRSLKLFRRWCDVETHCIVIDLVDDPLEHIEFE